MALIELHLYSETLEMDTELHVIYPHEHDEAPRKTLWLLHGSSGDSSVWLRNTTVEQIAEKYNIVTIMPDGIYSHFTDMYLGNKFASYVTGELPRVMGEMFPLLSQKREDNYVSGYSNGGYGAYLLGLTRPDVFGAIGAFSGANKVQAIFEKDGSSRAHSYYIAHGDPIAGGPTDTERMARELYAAGGPFPMIYQAAGEYEVKEEDTGPQMRAFLSGLSGNPFHYEYHVYPGYGHEWPMWQGELERFLGVYLGLPVYEKKPDPNPAAKPDFITPWNQRRAQPDVLR
jgi:S-formylglutathione hydrolase FrmB